MGRFLRKPHPHFVLLCLFCTHHGKIDNQHKNNHDAELNLREIGHICQQRGIFVVQMLRRKAVDGNWDMVARVFQCPQLACKIFLIGLRQVALHQRVDRVGKTEIPIHQNIVAIIDKQHRNIVVIANNAQIKVDIVRLHRSVGRINGSRRKRFRGIRPYFHAFALLHGQILHQFIGNMQEKCNKDD